MVGRGLRGSRGGVEVWVCAVVGLTLGGVAEDGVGFGELDEALGGGWVVGVAVWVVGFGELVEGSLRVVSLWFGEGLKIEE